MRILDWLIATFFTLLLLVVLALGLLQISISVDIDATAYKASIADYIKRAMGWDLTVDGHLTLARWPHA